MIRIALVLLVALQTGPAQGQEPPASDPADVVNALLGGLFGFADMSGADLQKEVAELGGVPFRQDVPLDFMSRDDLSRYLKEVLDVEYPPSRSEADERTLVAFDLLDRGTNLRRLRERILEDNVAGFYDERPGKKRLYAVSLDRRLTPSNQIILAHELRHALQDQYADLHDILPAAVGDFDDRRLALLSLLEGDATLVMERFLLRRLPVREGQAADFSDTPIPAPPVRGAPPVLRDQLVLPYTLGRDFARALLRSGGWDALRAAWLRPPESTEQILHPEKYLEREVPRRVEITYSPEGGKLLNEGVLGELLIGTLLGEDVPAAAASGWGGDRFRVWDVSGRTLLVWRSLWDTPGDARRFLEAVEARYRRSHGAGRRQGDVVRFERDGWSVAVGPREGCVILLASDDPRALRSALDGAHGQSREGS